MIYWEDAIIEAKENLGITGYTSDWAEVVEEAKEIMSDKNSEIAKEAHWVYLNSDEWKLKRIKVLERDNYLCQDCLKYINEIKLIFNKFNLGGINFSVNAQQVHHLDYEYKQTEFEEEYCISLCLICHQIRHCERRSDAERLIKNRKNNILNKAYKQLLKQPKFLEEAKEQHEDFLNSLAINPGDLEINEVENDKKDN